MADWKEGVAFSGMVKLKCDEMTSVVTSCCGMNGARQQLRAMEYYNVISIHNIWRHCHWFACMNPIGMNPILIALSDPGLSSIH